MSPFKSIAHKLIDDLPENSTWDDLMETIYVRKKIEKGLEASKNGEVVSHEDVKKMFSV